MSLPTPLPVKRLHASCSATQVPWPDSGAIPAASKDGVSPFHGRAMQALDLGLKINRDGYNIFLCGEPGLGRMHVLQSFLMPRASKMAVPDDLVYTRNFANPDIPSLLSLPAGHGGKFNAAVKEVIDCIRKRIGKLLNGNVYARQRAGLQSRYQGIRNELLHKMGDLAASQGFKLDMDENGAVVLSARRKGVGETPEQETIEPADLKKNGESLTKSLSVLMRELRKAEAILHGGERELEQSAMAQTLEACFPGFEQKILKIRDSQLVRHYLASLKEDLIANTDEFLPDNFQETENAPSLEHQAEDFFKRYDVNLFVDNSGLRGAPVIVEDHPNAVNLLGCIERESEMGALVTDFTLIRPGSVHRANGGFLIIRADDLLRHPLAWDGLLRALRANAIKMADEGEIIDAPMRTKGLRPEPVDLNIKVILIGNDDLYETLLAHEEDFRKLFRVKAHLNSDIGRTRANIRSYLITLAAIGRKDGLLPFDAGALAWLVDLGSHLCQDQRRLSLKFPLLREYMIEASALAEFEGATRVDSQTLERSYAQRAHRSNLPEELCQEDYERQVIKLKTAGSAVGQVNGLAVTCAGDYEFGLPHRISCSVGVGHDGIIDLEREAELGGPIHTKAMMILKSYLMSMFARKKPLVFTASLHFEQNYGEIEGDSASGAELAALLSALADRPARLDLAFTGAVSHSGEIMAVGGVTPKIEGFFKICVARGLTGSQGVIIPADNVDHLMLAPEVIESVGKGGFSIYPVSHIEEAITLLMGIPAGKRLKNGSFTKGSLFDLVDRRLEALGAYAQNAFKRPRKDKD